MGIDVDYLAAKQAIDELTEMLSNTPHGKREKLADDIIEAVEKIKEKYSKK